MPATPINTGPALIKVDTDATSTSSARVLETLGYTANGVEIEENRFLVGVPGDEHGGDDGPPIDIQDMGQVDTIRMDLTKFDDAVLNKIRFRFWNDGGVMAGDVAIPALGIVPTSHATQPSIGSFLFAGLSTFRLLIETVKAGGDRNYPIVVFWEPIVFNRGTKHTVARLVARAYRNMTTGVLWDTAGTTP